MKIAANITSTCSLEYFMNWSCNRCKRSSHSRERSEFRNKKIWPLRPKMLGNVANSQHTLSPGMFFDDMVCHLSVLCSDVVLGTIYPEEGSHSTRESPAYDTKHSTLPITWPLSLIERCIKATNIIIDPSFGVVISTISHWYSSTQIIFHNTIHKHSDWQKLTWLSWAWRKMARDG